MTGQICQATTKAGHRCRNWTLGDNAYCYQHGGQRLAGPPKERFTSAKAAASGGQVPTIKIDPAAMSRHRVMRCLGLWHHQPTNQQVRVESSDDQDGIKLWWERRVPGYPGSEKWPASERYTVSNASDFLADVERGWYGHSERTPCE
jgi:hypothetical protein